MKVSLRSIEVREWLTWRFCRWLFRAIFNWRTARRVLLAIAALVTLIAIAYAVENWRGRRAWEQVKREMEAQGEPLSLSGFIPPPVPDDENFAMAPFWHTALSGDETGSPRERSFPLMSQFWSPFPRPFRRTLMLDPSGNWLKAERNDLSRFQQYYRELHDEETPGLPEFPIPSQPGVPAEDVLMALSRYDKELEELRTAAQKPESRFQLRYEDAWNMSLPHLDVLRGASDFLGIRSLAELELRRSDAAFADVQLQFRLIDAIKTEPVLMSHVVRIHMAQTVLEAIWHGTAGHVWTDPQLVAFDKELQSFDVLSLFDDCRQSERAFALKALDWAQTSRGPEMFRALYQVGEQTQREVWGAIFRAMPRGWFDQNKVFYIRKTAELGTLRASPAARHIDSVDWRRRCAAVLTETAESRPYSFLGAAMSPWQPAALSLGFIKTEALIRLAQTACALERYRLAHGRYPESLSPLAPQFITAVPNDVIDGGELKYRRTDDDCFVLYSIGWNGKDDGGNVALKGNRWVNDKEGDWVWKYPP